ncbi:Mycobacterium numidiamassiliense ORFan [Mycobacterium numidiamassiliense]|uniref:Mycobacterium numidiamassiliense ORFan n=1 Tax=Mycobacterium numidiamassiliense TaxID=1841861 RepID=A0A2U3PHY2_9MYCO|nr:hypothetical protein [Mycobacterium numidiamassiliense]SPM43351.1 Mycobacterium numidiamassiliense ORFan [Mycobacterium numidiamassiliense]
MALVDEVLNTIKGIEENAHAPHTTEEALKIAQIKALIIVAQAIEQSNQ